MKWTVSVNWPHKVDYKHASFGVYRTVIPLALKVGLVMKSVPKIFAFVVAILLLIGVAFTLSPLSKQTASLRVEVVVVGVEGPQGHQAILVNDGYLPVVVSRCNSVSDNVGEKDTRVGDAIQRWDAEHSIWVTAYERRECTTGGWGKSARYSHALLWPGGRLHSSRFFHSTQDRVVHTGDKVRFLVFTQAAESDSPSIASQSFVAE